MTYSLVNPVTRFRTSSADTQEHNFPEVGEQIQQSSENCKACKSSAITLLLGRRLVDIILVYLYACRSGGLLCMMSHILSGVCKESQHLVGLSRGQRNRRRRNE